MSNWSELFDDLLIGIVERIKKLEDFINFGAVCKTWSEARKKEHFKGLWLRQKTPYLMLSVRNENEDIREFYSLVEDEIVASLRIPKLKSRKCIESLGWLLATENDGSMCLLDPFTSVEIPVPHQTTFPLGYCNPSDEYVFVRKMVLSARPSETYDFMVMIVCGDLGHIAFWRPGDKSWNCIQIYDWAYTDVMYHDGNFYAITFLGRAWVFRFEGDNQPERQLVARLIDDNQICSEFTLNLDMNFYILKTSQSLFIILRHVFDFTDDDVDDMSFTTQKNSRYMKLIGLKAHLLRTTT